MTSFRLQHLRVENYRCFETLTLPLEPDITVLFAENGGGKTVLFTALAMGLAVLQEGVPCSLKLNRDTDPRKHERHEPVGPCTVSWKATSSTTPKIEWSTTVNPASGRVTKDYRSAIEAIEQIRTPESRWPLFAWYGANRNTSLNTPLLLWLQEEMFGDAVRERCSEPSHFFGKAVMEAVMCTVPGITSTWFDPVRQSPMVRLETDHVVPWTELSDGYRMSVALVADIARRTVMLNEADGVDAPWRAEGVVLIDGIDLHLHPQWQRTILPRLHETFPRLQFIVTTHSPQVLSSVTNRQVRRLIDRRLQEHDVFVEGRDTNAILRELMGTPDHDTEGTHALQTLHDAVDQGRHGDAVKLYQELLTRWGDLDPSLIRAKVLMDSMIETRTRSPHGGLHD